jgi:hypothetical protein
MDRPIAELLQSRGFALNTAFDAGITVITDFNPLDCDGPANRHKRHRASLSRGAANN